MYIQHKKNDYLIMVHHLTQIINIFQSEQGSYSYKTDKTYLLRPLVFRCSNKHFSMILLSIDTV